MNAYDYQQLRGERVMSFGRFDLDTLIRACLGLRLRAPERKRAIFVLDDEPHPDFEDTMPAARAAISPLP